MTATLHTDDLVTINGRYAGWVASRKGEHVNPPSAREGQTTVFYPWENGVRGEAVEIDAPAMVKFENGTRSRLNPMVVAEIQRIMAFGGE